MKIESAYGDEVCFEYWDTPVMYNDQLWLLAELRTMNDIHFFLKLNSISPDDIHVLSISSGWPLRITDETYAYNCIGKYLKQKVPPQEEERHSSTYKIWNTSFIKDIEENNALSGYALERNKNIFEYLIITQDEYIEFISLDSPRWTFHEGAKIVELVNIYMKRSFEG